MTTQLLNVLLMLGITIGVFLGVMMLIKKIRENPKFHSSIEVLGGASLSAKAKVILVSSENTKMLLGVTDHQVTKLHVFDKTPFEQALSEQSET